MKLSKQTSDAVNVLLYCMRCEDERVKVAVIAGQLGLTKQMALKLANRLGRAGLLTTVRGPKGGVKLSDVALELPLGHIVERLETVLSDAEDKVAPQPFDQYFDDAFRVFLDVLDQHTLKDMAAMCSSKNAAQSVGRKRRSRESRAANALSARALREMESVSANDAIV